ncbi:MAG: hypothetical protein ACRDN0_01830 [Trebonia sp.]
MATTRSRPRGRETARPNTGGPVAEHLSKIYGFTIVGAIVIVAFLTLTSVGHVVDLAVQHFMLFYAGVFALIALCASVGAGLVSTDRMFLHPGQRVMMQSIHRAVSFGALVFLIIHIVTEILAQRIHVIDAFIPFLVPFKTFYIGLGTIASDLIILIVITGVLRKRFTSNGKNVWRWRAIHYSSYLAFVFGVWHGLLGGRAGKPYVDWSYGFVVAFVALGLAVRILANSLRPKESLSSAPVSESASSGSAPMRAASMFAQLGLARATGPAAMAVSGGAVSGGALGMLPGGARTGSTPAMAALPSAPGYPQAAVVQSSAQTMMRGPAQTLAAPVYEPGYDGPPRYVGTPRNTGPMPQAPGAPSGPWQRPMTGPMPGPMPAAATGSMPQAPGAPSGPWQRPVTGPVPRAASGPMPRAGTGPQPMPGGPGQQYVGQGYSGQQYGGQQYSGPEYRSPEYGSPQYGGPQPGQVPWENGLLETDPNLKYRTPGPGMPGYRAPGDRYRGSDNIR